MRFIAVQSSTLCCVICVFWICCILGWGVLDWLVLLVVCSWFGVCIVVLWVCSTNGYLVLLGFVAVVLWVFIVVMAFTFV